MPTTEVLSLWPETFKADVQTPLFILRTQAGLLSKVTSGILQGTVETEQSKDKIQHRLVVIAPACEGYRRTLVTVIHDRQMAYPAEIQARALAKVTRNPEHPEHPDVDSNNEIDPRASFSVVTYPKANSDAELRQFVKQVLQSGETEALILSLIAKSNEAHEGTGDEAGA